MKVTEKKASDHPAAGRRTMTPIADVPTTATASLRSVAHQPSQFSTQLHTDGMNRSVEITREQFEELAADDRELAFLIRRLHEGTPDSGTVRLVIELRDPA